MNTRSVKEERAIGRLPATGYVRLRQVLEVIPICRSAWWAGVQSGKYPQPVRHHPFGRVTVWRADDIRALLAATEGADND